jgi:two-component system chemotaxis response regulator CheY
VAGVPIYPFQKTQAGPVLVDRSIAVLVVDDFTAVCDVITALLEEIGFQNVQEVVDGASALGALQDRHFDLVLSDWKMEPMSGLGLLNRIRQDGRLRHVRFILTSGDCNSRLAETAQALGAHGFLWKPFTAEVLGEAIERAFSLPASRGA